MTGLLREIDWCNVARTTRRRKLSRAVTDGMPVEGGARRVVRREHVFDAQRGEGDVETWVNVYFPRHGQALWPMA